MKRYASSVFNGRTEDLEYITFICDLHFMVLATRVRRYKRIIDMQNSSSLDLKRYANLDYRSLLLEVFCMLWYCLVLMLSSFLVCTHIGEMGKDERRDNVHFSSFWFTIDFLLSYQNIDGVYWVWGRLIFQRAQAPAVNYPKASVPRASLHSRIYTL